MIIYCIKESYILFNKHTETNQELVNNITKITGLKDEDIKIIIDCISNEIINLVLIKNKKIKFGALGTFEYQFRDKFNAYKVPKKKVKYKKIVLKNSSLYKKISEEALKQDKESYENRIIW